jgi:hypothetical protein
MAAKTHSPFNESALPSETPDATAPSEALDEAQSNRGRRAPRTGSGPVTGSGAGAGGGGNPEEYDSDLTV